MLEALGRSQPGPVNAFITPPGRLFSSSRPKRRVLTLAASGLAALVIPSIWNLAPRLVWNATASSPVGLYWISSEENVRPGDMVIAWAPEQARQLGALRRYVPRNVPLIKRVVAVAGDRVCAVGDTIRVADRIVARRRAADPSGRPMPWWSGCERLRGGDVLLLTPGAPLAFDGRYFGITRRELLVGRARLLWER